MGEIHKLVKDTLKSGYLTLQAEDSLRSMLMQHYGDEDFDAFIQLQQAVISGQVKQQSREQLFC